MASEQLAVGQRWACKDKRRPGTVVREEVSGAGA